MLYAVLIKLFCNLVQIACISNENILGSRFSCFVRLEGPKMHFFCIYNFIFSKKVCLMQFERLLNNR